VNDFTGLFVFIKLIPLSNPGFLPLTHPDKPFVFRFLASLDFVDFIFLFIAALQVALSACVSCRNDSIYSRGTGGGDHS